MTHFCMNMFLSLPKLILMYKNSLCDIKRFSTKQLLLLYVNELDLWL